jgi:hypothetical protein
MANKLPLIIPINKMSAKKKEIICLKQNLELLLKPFALKLTKIEGHLIMYLHQFHSR